MSSCTMIHHPHVTNTDLTYALNVSNSGCVLPTNQRLPHMMQNAS